MAYFEYAAKLDDDSVEDISAFAMKYGWILEPELRSILFDSYGNRYSPYVTMTWDVVNHEPDAFQTCSGSTLEARWHFCEGMRGPFRRIWKN